MTLSTGPGGQDFNDNVMENGSFLFYKKPPFLRSMKAVSPEKISVYVMKEETGIEIDEPEDWPEAEQAFKKLKSNDISNKDVKKYKSNCC